MTIHRGSCLCGTVSFTVEGDFDSFYLCHCKHCQKDTGSAHAANLFSQSAQLSWLSGNDAVTLFTLPDSRHSRSFCKHCGSALPNTQNEGMLVVPAGCLDTEVTLTPTAHLFTASSASWEELIDKIPVFAGFPTRS
ncbi:aldehyde-activating protein [Pseudidiomarina atlantica]|uniref:Aldehyde-activating protein n=1 Tax=Pseudidiomarina atlantica TaxID=1517416 RepID=A0A094L1Q7_9GAMM|nr:GFA family protein [Pseudidiomarina atlantica]KFZ28558.1 aldehyde-activating protein [Pseudidiomarina atlantica]